MGRNARKLRVPAHAGQAGRITRAPDRPYDCALERHLVKSGDVSMLSQLEIARALEAHEAGPSAQWDRQDFVSVAEVIDTLFSKLGWLI